ncbi:hypothetical protein M9H77_30109 [Catharanthus roseus]|uniref:Uncharacterized protein n=1 Tax=Catharanthus roseus TaxID=4058 RepID=A0ACB9ZYX4_CATRO|nr:hypothetical protein M9H77_30109 [Catharanthus roseus]
MQEDDNIIVFSNKLRGIANKAFQLGETYTKEKLARKTLRTRRISKPQGRFKTDNRDRKGPNKFMSEGSTMKKKGKEREGDGHIQVECANTFDDDKKSDVEDDKEDTDSNETLAFNVLIDLEDISMNNDRKMTVKMIPSIVMKNLLYIKCVGLVKLHQDLKDRLKKIQEQKDTLERRNHVLIAQVKDVTDRVNKPAGMKSGLGYTGTNLNHTKGIHVTQHGSSHTMYSRLEGVFIKDSLSQAEKRNLIKEYKPRKPSLMYDYYKMIERKDIRLLNNHPTDAIISDITEDRRTISKKGVDYNQMAVMISMTCSTSILEPKNFKEALTDEYWIKVMQEELQ